MASALDDGDGFVRRVAFTALVLTRPTLARWLVARDEWFSRALDDLARQACCGEESPTDDQVKAARAALLPDGAASDATPGEADREPLLAALACRTPDTALRGARGLALMGDMRALGALLTLSRDPSTDLRRDAALALASLDDPRSRRRLAWMLNDAETSVRDTALQCLQRLEPRRSTWPRARCRPASRTSGPAGSASSWRYGKEHRPGLHAARRRPRRRGGAVRNEVTFRTFWAWHTGDPLAAIDRALEGRFPDVRRRAVQELANLAKPVALRGRRCSSWATPSPTATRAWRRRRSRRWSTWWARPRPTRRCAPWRRRWRRSSCSGPRRAFPRSRPTGSARRWSSCSKTTTRACAARPSTRWPRCGRPTGRAPRGRCTPGSRARTSTCASARPSTSPPGAIRRWSTRCSRCCATTR
ncbi:MAG: HEAT repeat domain-containing protein [Myxococcota bacterium]